MKVKEAVEQLLKLNQEAEFIGASANFELYGAYVPISSIHQYNEGSKEMQRFRDAFDGGTYSKEIWSPFGGELPVVIISQ